MLSASDGSLRNPIWTRDELILALDLYLATIHSPPGKGSAEVAELSATLNQLGRMLDRRGGTDFRNSNGVYVFPDSGTARVSLDRVQVSENTSVGVFACFT